MGMPSSVKKSVTLARLCTLPHPVETKSTPTVRRATSSATESVLFVSASARSPSEIHRLFEESLPIFLVLLSPKRLTGAKGRGFVLPRNDGTWDREPTRGGDPAPGCVHSARGALVEPGGLGRQARRQARRQ